MIGEPFTPEELCRRLAGLLASPPGEACGHRRLDPEDRLISRELEALAIGSKKKD